jgi:hypothetical protein
VAEEIQGNDPVAFAQLLELGAEGFGGRGITVTEQQQRTAASIVQVAQPAGGEGQVITCLLRANFFISGYIY